MSLVLLHGSVNEQTKGWEFADVVVEEEGLELICVDLADCDIVAAKQTPNLAKRVHESHTRLARGVVKHGEDTVAGREELVERAIVRGEEVKVQYLPLDASDAARPVRERFVGHAAVVVVHGVVEVEPYFWVVPGGLPETEPRVFAAVHSRDCNSGNVAVHFFESMPIGVQLDRAGSLLGKEADNSGNLGRNCFIE